MRSFLFVIFNAKVFPVHPPSSPLPCSIQDIGILFNVIIILLMMFNTYVFQVGLVSVLLQRFRALLLVSAVYLTLSIIFHCWVMVRSNADQSVQRRAQLSPHPCDFFLPLLPPEPQVARFQRLRLDRRSAGALCFPENM